MVALVTGAHTTQGHTLITGCTALVTNLVSVTLERKGAYFLPSTELSFLIDCCTESSQPFYEVITVTVIPIWKMLYMQLRGACPGVPGKLWNQDPNSELSNSTRIGLNHHAVL